MEVTGTSHPRSFRAGFATAIGLLLISALLNFGIAELAPKLFQQIEAIGKYQLKPWIYAFPFPVGFACILFLVPGFRAARALAGFFVGTVSGVLLIGVVGYVVVLQVVGKSLHG